LAEYRRAEAIDDTAPDAHVGAGRVLLMKKDYAHSVEEFRKAEELRPGWENVHDLEGQALEGSGNMAGAISAYRESLALNGKQLQVMIELALALEKTGDWAAAMTEYREAAGVDASIDLRNKVTRTTDRDPQKEYAAAQERFSAHLASLKAAGKSAEAASLQARVQNISASAGLSEKLDAAMQAGAKANSERRWDEAKKAFQEAVDLAEKIQPHDSRLITALDHLGNENLKEHPDAAQAAFERELKVSEEVYGPQTPGTVPALQSLGNNAMVEHDYANAEKYYFRAVDINEKAFGEGSDAVAQSLQMASAVYLMQKDYGKAEPYLLRALRTEESLHGNDNIGLVALLSELSYLYDGWGKPDKAEPYYHQTLTVIEKQYGENSPILQSVLTKDAAELRSLGKSAEADQEDKQLASIRAATMKAN
jgi:hypothetical protein